MIELVDGMFYDHARGEVVVEGIRFDAEGLRTFIAAAEVGAVVRLEVGEGGESIGARRLETWPPAEDIRP